MVLPSTCLFLRYCLQRTREPIQSTKIQTCKARWRLYLWFLLSPFFLTTPRSRFVLSTNKRSCWKKVCFLAWIGLLGVHRRRWTLTFLLLGEAEANLGVSKIHSTRVASRAEPNLLFATTAVLPCRSLGNTARALARVDFGGTQPKSYFLEYSVKNLNFDK